MAAAVAVIVGLAEVVIVVRPRRIVVEGNSMLPTLLPGDRVLVARTGHPRIGQIVLIRDPRHPGSLLLKRIDSSADGQFMVMGDNEEASTDSRTFGPVGRDAILGRVVRRYGPTGRSGPVR